MNTFVDGMEIPKYGGICFAKYIYAEMFPDMTILECKDCAVKHLCNLPAKDKNILTNADRIRAMTDEELAEYMIGVAQRGGIPLNGKPIRWIDWLKQEASDDEC